MNQERIFSRPSSELVAAYIKWFPVVLSAFIVIYYSTNAYAASQTDHYHLYADWELSIPLVPPMIIIYLGYVGIFGVVPFVFKTPKAVKGLAYCMLVTMMVSGVIFVLFPGHLGYRRPDDVPGYGLLFSFLYEIDRPHNLFPSVHVSFAYLCALSMIHQTSQRWFHVLLKIWFAMVCASVILVHQHHVFDIVLGMILSWAIFKKVYFGIITAPAEKQEESLADPRF